MKILVTGATGLVGSNLVQRLESNGNEVLGMSRSLGNDLRDKEKTAHTIRSFGPEFVFHLAANAAESRGQISPIDMTENNINIFLNVLVPSINIGVKRFIYTSSVAVYGEAEVPYAEDDIPKPKDVYGVNKLACEQILKILAKVHDFDYTIFRPHNLYGPHQDMANPYKNVVALFMRNLIEDKECVIYGEGKMRRAFSYIDDVVDIMCDVSNTFRNQTVNVGSSIETDIHTLLTRIEAISGKSARIVNKPARAQEIYLFLASHRRLNTLSEYHETPLDEGLRKTWEYLAMPPLEKHEDEIC